jgi:ADP-heptose:LPS heptosyltransferase
MEDLSNVPIQKIAILRALQLGDLLCSIPAIRALRNAYPNAEITLFGLPWASTLVERFPDYFDRFIHFPGIEGLPEQVYNADAYVHFVDTMRSNQFDLLIQMQGSGSFVNEMLPQLGAKVFGGFYTDGHLVPGGLFMPYPATGHEITRHVRLMQFFGIEPQGLHLEFPLTENDSAIRLLEQYNMENRDYVIVHPGSRGSWRQWPPEHFAMIADYCFEQGFPVFVTGTANEGDICKEVIGWMRHPAFNVAGQTNLGTIGALIKGACMLLSNCTGVSHIASAMETPSIVISMDGEPERWGPMNRELHVTYDWTSRQKLEEVFFETAKMLRKIKKQQKVAAG